MWTENVTWFSNEEGKKGRIEVGQFADLIVPDRDYFSCAEDEIADTTSDLTMVGGKIVYGAGEFARFDEGAPPPAMPDWSPVRTFGGYAAWGEPNARRQAALAASWRWLRLRQRLRHPWPRACRRLVEPAADRGPANRSGARSAAPAGRCDVSSFEA